MHWEVPLHTQQARGPIHTGTAVSSPQCGESSRFLSKAGPQGNAEVEVLVKGVLGLDTARGVH